jgi:hypothetical protein
MIKFQLSTGAQTFTTNLGDLYVQITLQYREADGGGWFLDIETTDGEKALYGIPIVCGVDLLAQHQYRGLGHLYALVDGRYDGTPTYDDMGSDLELYWEA